MIKYVFVADDANIPLVSFSCLSSLYLVSPCVYIVGKLFPAHNLVCTFLIAGDLASRLKGGQQTLERKQIELFFPVDKIFIGC